MRVQIALVLVIMILSFTAGYMVNEFTTGGKVIVNGVVVREYR